MKGKAWFCCSSTRNVRASVQSDLVLSSAFVEMGFGFDGWHAKVNREACGILYCKIWNHSRGHVSRWVNHHAHYSGQLQDYTDELRYIYEWKSHGRVSLKVSQILTTCGIRKAIIRKMFVDCGGKFVSGSKPGIGEICRVELHERIGSPKKPRLADTGWKVSGYSRESSDSIAIILLKGRYIVL